MSRGGWPAFPNPDDEIAHIKEDDIAYYERNDDLWELWDDHESARTFPTRPFDAELMPSHDGHLTLEELAEWQDEEQRERQGRRAWRAKAG